MKKSLILVGLLSIGYAHAQYDEKVGVNTDQPESTLTVKSQKGLGPYSSTFELQNAANRKLMLAFDHGKISFNSGKTAEYRFDINSVGDHYNYNSMALRVISNSSLGGAFELFRARGKAIGNNNDEELQAVQKGDISSAIHTRAYTGIKYVKNAGILTSITGDVTDQDVPTSMSFYTTNKGENLNQTMTIHHTSRVGINTENPGATLNVKSKTGTNGGTKNLELVNANDKPLFTVLDNANIGINNDKPGYLLDIKGTDNSYIRNSIALRGFRADGSFGIDLLKARGTTDTPAVVEQNDLVGHLGFMPYNGTKHLGSGFLSARVTGEVTPDKAVPTSLDFRVVKDFEHANASNSNVAMRIYHDGNIGMGTIEPTHKLHIKADAGKDPLKIEGLQLSNLDTEDILVAGADGIIKKVSRTTFSGGGNTTPAETITGSNGLTKTGSEVKLGGTLKEVTTITQDNHSIKFVNRTNDNTEATAKVEIEGTTYLNGSVYKRYTVMTQSGELPNNAAFIENNSADRVTITLPEGQIGREVCFFQSGAGSINFTGPNGKTGMVKGQQITIASQAGLCLISNGKFWMQVTGY